jgi:hypothetical protein
VLGIVIEVRPLQEENVLSAMVVMLLGRLIEVRPELWNAEDPMLVTELGIVSDVRPVQP